MTYQTTNSNMNSDINSRWSHVKLSEQSRLKLRDAVRQHPSVAEHLRPGPPISRLRKEALLNLSDDLGINYEKVLLTSPEQHPDISSRPTRLAPNASDPFAGQIAFDFAMEFLGKKVTRPARIHYTHSPDWAYFDRESGKEVASSGEGGSYFLELQSVAESEVTQNGREAAERGRTFRKRLETAWQRCNDLTAIGIWSEEIWDEVRDQIDRKCREQDAAHRLQSQHQARIHAPSAA